MVLPLFFQDDVQAGTDGLLLLWGPRVPAGGGQLVELAEAR